MCIKMSKLEYCIGDMTHVGHSIEGEFLSLEKPKWFTTQPVITHNEAKSVPDYIRKYWNDLMHFIPESVKTSKSCPGFNTLFKHSVAIKFPCDILLEIDENLDYKYQTKSRYTVLKSITHHGSGQLQGMPGNYVAIKFEFDCHINVKNTLVQFIDPLYWNDVPYKVSPGLVECKAMPLNTIAFFSPGKYHFKAGSVLSVMTFSNPITHIESADLKKAALRRLWQSDKHVLKRPKWPFSGGNDD
jgi:hypothetical protein